MSFHIPQHAMRTPELAIIVVNWNTRELLAQCLRSLYRTSGASTRPATRNLRPASHALGPHQSEVWVIDNASTDGSAQMVREHFPWVRLIENTENIGFAAANNQAICQSQGRYLVLLNSDTEVYPGAMETMVQFMEEHPRVGGCGPLLLNADGSLQVSCHPMLTPEREFWRVLLFILSCLGGSLSIFQGRLLRYLAWNGAKPGQSDQEEK